MSNRLRTTHDDLQLTQIPARAIDYTAGIPMEMSDRRSVSIFAMFAIDEPEDARLVSSLDGGICAFLPTACTDTWSSVSRSRPASS